VRWHTAFIPQGNGAACAKANTPLPLSRRQPQDPEHGSLCVCYESPGEKQILCLSFFCLTQVLVANVQEEGEEKDLRFRTLYQFYFDVFK
jgi:hypothetical protein